MASYIKYLFKTVRKFFGEAVVVTQEVDDIISSPVVKETIITIRTARYCLTNESTRTSSTRYRTCSA